MSDISTVDHASVDEDGFNVRYDVILSGTGLVQSILSAAFSKSGKKVLHLDHNDYYGGDYHATHTLEQFLNLCNNNHRRAQIDDDDLQRETTEIKDEDDGIEKVVNSFTQRGYDLLSKRMTQSLHSGSTSPLYWMSAATSAHNDSSNSIVTVDCSSSCSVDVRAAEKAITQVRSAQSGSPACRGYLMERLVSCSTSKDSSSVAYNTAACHPCFFGYRTDHTLTPTRLLHDSRRFQIDSNPKLLLSAGKMVDAIVSSGVGHYLEFKSVESIYYVASKSVSAASVTSSITKKMSQASSAVAAASTLQLWKVPCSKKDIFNTKMFSALEKRSLMKLMQYAVDYGREKDGLPVTTLNENELAQGRALFRPQNKMSGGSSGSGSGGVLQSKEEEMPQVQKTFFEFLNDSTVPARLQEFVTHALCLDSRPAPAIPSRLEGLDNLYRHINASGRYGETSFLIPVYGTSEFAQAFCRLSAVWGGIFLLRESLSKVLIAAASAPRDDQTSDSASSSRVLTSQLPSLSAVKLSNNKYIACDHLICDETLQEVFCEGHPPSSGSGGGGGSVRYVQRHAILTEPFLVTSLSGDESGEGRTGIGSTRGVCIFPAQTPGLDNSHAVYLLQLDESTQVAPAGAYVVYLMTYITCSEKRYTVTESDGNSSNVLELMTEVEAEERGRAVDLMNRTVDMLREVTGSASSGNGNSHNQKHEEIYYATFLHPPQPASALSLSASALSRFSNVHMCNNSTEKILYIHDAVCQAETIFKKMYPGDVFLEDTEENNTAKTRYVPEDDDDGLGALLSTAERVAASTSSVVTTTSSSSEDNNIGN